MASGVEYWNWSCWIFISLHYNAMQCPITLADTYRFKCTDLSGIRLPLITISKIILVKFTYPGQRPKIRSLSYYGSWWKSIMSKDLIFRFFIATIESILLYGCESRALSKGQEKSLNGTYTRMLRKAFNIHWSSHIPNQQLYGELQAVSNKMASPRLELEGHCYRHPEFSPLRAHTWSSREEDRKLPILTLLLHWWLRRDCGKT